MANRWGGVETVTDFIFLDCKITVDSDCSHEIKGCWDLGRKAMTNLDRALKSRVITLPTKVCIVKAIEYMTTGKTIALNIWTFVGRVISLLFNTLSRFVIAFLPRYKLPLLLSLVILHV